MSAQTVLIISGDKDFSPVVAEQVKRELSLAAMVAENSVVAKSALASAAVIVTSEPAVDDAPCPVIAVNPPVRLPQLLEDITVLLQKPADEALALGHGFNLQLRQKQLAHSGKTADLTDKEAQLLQRLAEAGDKAIGKDQLLKDIWGIEAGLNTHTLETHIYRLRGKCRELAGDELIEAAEGGYRLANG